MAAVAPVPSTVPKKKKKKTERRGLPADEASRRRDKKKKKERGVIISPAGRRRGTRLPPPGANAIRFHPCPHAPAFGCARLTVALDPTGAVPGTVKLAMRRRLAGGAAAPVKQDAGARRAESQGRGRDPQRRDDAHVDGPGSRRAISSCSISAARAVGSRSPAPRSPQAQLTCRRRASRAPMRPAPPAATTRRRTPSTTSSRSGARSDTGGSCSTARRTARRSPTRYAAAHPGRRRRPDPRLRAAERPDVFRRAELSRRSRRSSRSSAAAAVARRPGPARRPRRRCSPGSAPGPSTADPRRGTGSLQPATIDAGALRSLLLAGDFDPVLRSDLPAALHAAAANDFGPLALLVGPGAGRRSDQPPRRSGHDAAVLRRRVRGAAVSVAALGPSGGPLREGARRGGGPAAGIARSVQPGGRTERRAPVRLRVWPNADPAPEPAVTALPDVPTLLLSGAADFRTPVSGADEVRALIPDATRGRAAANRPLGARRRGGGVRQARGRRLLRRHGGRGRLLAAASARRSCCPRRPCRRRSGRCPAPPARPARSARRSC